MHSYHIGSIISRGKNIFKLGDQKDLKQCLMSLKEVGDSTKMCGLNREVVANRKLNIKGTEQNKVKRLLQVNKSYRFYFEIKL